MTNTQILAWWSFILGVVNLVTDNLVAAVLLLVGALLMLLGAKERS